MCSVRETGDRAQARYLAASAERLRAVADLASSGAWQGDGAVNLAAWLASRWQMAYPAARELVRQAEALEARPALREALVKGAISTDQCKALTVLCREGTDDDEVWLEGLDTWSLHELQQLARKVVAKELERRDDGVYMRMRHTPDERYMRGEFQLHPEDGALVLKAIEDHVPPDTSMRDWDRAMGHALVEMARAGPASGPSATVLLSVSAESLAGVRGSETAASLDTGGLVGTETARRLSCDAAIQQLVRDASGAVLGIGRTSRKVPPRIRRAVLERDGARCTFTDCTHDRFLICHHIVEWADGGPTDVPNLQTVCHPHHVLLHEGRWSLRGPAGPSAEWIRPDGSPHQPRVRVTLDTC
jgi:hypothetical protein